MPSRDWSNGTPHIVFIGLLVIFVGVVVWDALEYPRPRSIDQSYDASAYAEQAEQSIAVICAGKTGIEKAICAAEVHSSYTEEHQAERDLSAQRYMAFWAFWMVVASLIAAGATLYGLILLQRTWQETKRTVDVSRDIGSRQLRAYVGIDTNSVVIDHENQTLSYSLRIRNFGQTPAYRLRIGHGIQFRPIGERRRLHFSVEDRRANDRGQVFPDVMPGAVVLAERIIKIGNYESAIEMWRKGTHEISVHAVGRYRDAFRVSRRFTISLDVDLPALLRGQPIPMQVSDNGNRTS